MALDELTGYDRNLITSAPIQRGDHAIEINLKCDIPRQHCVSWWRRQTSLSNGGCLCFREHLRISVYHVRCAAGLHDDERIAQCGQEQGPEGDSPPHASHGTALLISPC